MAKEVKKSTTGGATEAKKRNTFFIHPETTKKIKYIALMEDKTQTDVVEEALDERIAKYEKKHGPINTK